VTYLHRTVYAEKHSFGDNPTVKEFFERIMRKVNAEDFDEVLTGFLLCYRHIFVHIVKFRR
jgi:ABC-type sulfate transport system substrate-binding protein